MGKFQDVSFEDINDFLDYLPKNERIVTELLRELILDCLPNAKEKLSYNVPYYSIFKRICFIWPASIPWGKVKEEGVLIGFCHGNLLSDPDNYLEKGNRKQVHTKTFFNPGEIDIEKIKYFIFESVEIDRQIKQARKKS